MAINYNKLWKLLIDKGMTKTQLRQATEMSTKTLAKLGRNESVSMDTMLKICECLNCDLNDILELTK